MTNFNNYITGPVGFIISIITLIISLRINDKISKAFDRKELREKQADISQTLDDYIDLFEINRFSSEDFRSLRTYLYRLNSDYPFLFHNKSKGVFLNKSNQVDLAKLLQLIDDYSSNARDIIPILVELETIIRKEARL